MTKLARVIGLLLLLNAPLAAQDTPFIARSGTRPLVRPDGTYVFQHIPHSDLVFEGQIAPRTHLWRRTAPRCRRTLGRVLLTAGQDQSGT